MQGQDIIFIIHLLFGDVLLRVTESCSDGDR